MFRAAALTAAALLTASPAFAEDCKAPGAPDMTTPGSELSLEAYNAITTSLTSYDDGLVGYRACLDGVINAPDRHDVADWRAALEAYNAISTQQAALYARYDIVSKDFQIAQASRASAAAREANAASVADSQARLQEEMATLNQ